MSTRKNLEIDLPDENWMHLGRLAAVMFPESDGKDALQQLVGVLLDRAQQGVYRSGAWERRWLEQRLELDAVEAAY